MKYGTDWTLVFVRRDMSEVRLIPICGDVQRETQRVALENPELRFVIAIHAGYVIYPITPLRDAVATRPGWPEITS